jgi:hypothetical protein
MCWCFQVETQLYLSHVLLEWRVLPLLSIVTFLLRKKLKVNKTKNIQRNPDSQYHLPCPPCSCPCNDFYKRSLWVNTCFFSLITILRVQTLFPSLLYMVLLWAVLSWSLHVFALSFCNRSLDVVSHIVHSLHISILARRCQFPILRLCGWCERALFSHSLSNKAWAQSFGLCWSDRREM